MAFLYLDSYRTVGEKVGNSLWFISVLRKKLLVTLIHWILKIYFISLFKVSENGFICSFFRMLCLRVDVRQRTDGQGR